MLTFYKHLQTSVFSDLTHLTPTTTINYRFLYNSLNFLTLYLTLLNLNIEYFYPKLDICHLSLRNRGGLITCPKFLICDLAIKEI